MLSLQNSDQALIKAFKSNSYWAIEGVTFVCQKRQQMKISNQSPGNINRGVLHLGRQLPSCAFILARLSQHLLSRHVSISHLADQFTPH